MINTKNLIWQDINQTSGVPSNITAWLNDDKSLTSKLKQKFADFSVKVLSQQQGYPHADETSVLNNKDKCVIREVALLGGGNVVVFARSIIPITPATQKILNIGSKPLGEILFNDNNINRETIQITHTNNIWGRRSIFSIDNTQLLVCEFFMEELYA